MTINFKNMKKHIALGSKRWVICLILVSSLGVMTPAFAGNMSCSSATGFEKLSCWTVVGTILGLGAIVYAFDAAGSALKPSTDALVALPSGERPKAKIEASLMKGRRVEKGQELGLSCKVNSPAYDYEYGFASCTLEYPKLQPKPQSRDYYERMGNQPSYDIGANKEGVVKGLVLERPLRWVEGEGF
jgi:hypothetical protein